MATISWVDLKERRHGYVARPGETDGQARARAAAERWLASKGFSQVRVTEAGEDGFWYDGPTVFYPRHVSWERLRGNLPQ